MPWDLSADKKGNRSGLTSAIPSQCNPFTAVGAIGVEAFRSGRRIGTPYVPSRILADGYARLPLPLVGNCLTIEKCPARAARRHRICMRKIHDETG